MPVVASAPSTILAYHGTHGGGGGNLSVLFVFLGVIATAVWLIFSELQWRHTVAVTVAGWAAGLSLAVVF